MLMVRGREREREERERGREAEEREGEAYHTRSSVIIVPSEGGRESERNEEGESNLNGWNIPCC